MELRHLRSFQAVAEQLHFSRAAEMLHVAQPALSRTIADLEEEMGVLLIERNSRRVGLTEAGTLFLEYVRRILNETKDAVDATQRRARGETGTLRIGFIGTLSYDVLPRLLQAYHSLYPGVDLVLHELGPTQQRSEILAGRLDCGFIGLSAESQDTELEMVTVALAPLMVALPVAHPLATRSAVRLMQLKDDQIYLTARTNAPAFNPWVIELCRKVGFEPQIKRETDRAATVLSYIAAGFGVSIFPSQVAVLATPGVCFLPVRDKLPFYQYKLAWAHGNSNRALSDFAHMAKLRPRKASRGGASNPS